MHLDNAGFEPCVTHHEHVHDLLKHVNPQAWENQSLVEIKITLHDRAKIYLHGDHVQQWRRTINATVANLC